MKKPIVLFFFIQLIILNCYAQYEHLMEQEMVEVEVKKKEQPKPKEETNQVEPVVQNEETYGEQPTTKLVLPTKYKQKGFETQLRYSTNIGADLYGNFACGLDVILGYRVSPIFRFGFGTGIYYTNLLYEFSTYRYKEYREGAPTIPLFANVKFDFIKERKCSPFLGIDMGYNFFIPISPYASANNRLGFFFKTEVGVDIRFKKITLCPSIAYRFQVRENQIWVQDKCNYNQICFIIGVQF